VVVRSGDVLGGKYKLERKLGQGAMGTVWSATHVTLGQRVAIKLISAEHAQSAEARARFSVEAKAAARLKSRHVVQVYDDGETEEGTPYIVMEYLEGETLEARLEREKGVHLVDAVRITGQVARALSRAHSRGIVHRDLKPANIFLARNDEDELGWTAKVLDFGIAKIDEQRDKATTKTGAVLGTPLFMSPEQVRGASKVDARTDLYSLGLCFFNMLTGHYAFDGESFGDILVSICTEPLPNLKVFAPSVPDSVVAWFQRCCARDANDRFQSADELIEALQASVGGAVQLVPRGTVPLDMRGPSGTLRGHSAPLSPKTAAISTRDSAPLIALGPDDSGPIQPLPREFSRSDTATAVLTVHETEPTLPSKSRRGWYAALAAGVVVALAVGAVLFSQSGSQAIAATPTPPSVAASSFAAPALPAAAVVAAPVAEPPANVAVVAPEQPAKPAPSAAAGQAPPAKAARAPATGASHAKLAVPTPARKPAPAPPAHRPKRRSSPADLGF
jgi:serine/threonine-protein kinase